MLYVEDILLPGEKILHHAKVHYVLYFPGFMMMAAAIGLMYFMPDFLNWMNAAPDTASTLTGLAKFLSITCFMAGIAFLLKAWLKIYSTELVITNRRILLKVGVSTATTAEIDRSRISSVIVHKTLLGRMLNYGWINIRGYSGNITGLPAMAKPHEIQKHIYHEITT